MKPVPVRIATAGAVSILLLAIAVPAPARADGADQAAARALLSGRGLSAKASYYVLDSEIEFSRRLSALRKVRARLDDALERQQGFEERGRRHRDEIHRLVQQRQQISESLARSNSVRRHNQLIARSNALTDRIRLLESAVHDDDARRTVEAAVGAERQAYLEAVATLRALADSTRATYERLTEDAEVTAALATLSTGRKRPYVLGPRPNFARKLEQLAALERAVETGHIALRHKFGIHWLDVRLNGRVTREFVLDTGASGISLPAAYAAELGLVPGPDDPDYTFFVADGRSVTAKLMHLESVAVGDFEVRDLPCVVLPADMTDAPPLLGGTFLRHFVYSVDPASQKLTLSRVRRAE